jgi:RNA polymerase sigma factor (sigma-70 family)
MQTNDVILDEVTVLLQGVNRNDKKSFEAYFDLKAQTITTYLKGLLNGNLHEAEEITNDVFCRLWNMPGKTFSTLESVEHWLIQIATTRVNYHQLQNKKARNSEQYFVDAMGERVVENLTLSQERALLKALRSEAMKRALDDLPRQQNMVVNLYLDGYSVPEISRMTSLNQQTIRNYKNQAKDNLKKLLGDLGSIMIITALLLNFWR